MKILLSLIFCFTTLLVNAQKLDGLWVSSFRMNIQQLTERLDPDHGPVELDRIEVDTFYREAFGILEFLPQNKLVIKGLGKPEKYATYELRKDTILARLDTLQLKFLSYNDHLILLDPDSSWQFNHFVFERMSPNSSKKLTAPNLELNTYWVFQTDSNSINYGLELFVHDSGQLIVSQFHDDVSRTTFSDYNIDKFRNNLFLSFFDLINEKMIRLYDWEMYSFKAQSYEFGFGHEPPILTNFTLEKHELASRKTRQTIKKNLIGSWVIRNNGIPFDPEFSHYNSLENEYFNFLITKTDFEISYGAVFVNQNQKDFLTEKINGTWNLGTTAKYLELTYNNERIHYLTISKLSDDTFHFSLSLKMPDSDHHYSSQTIKLKGANNR